MMKFDIKHQKTYSRGELLLRSFFGFLYIGIPHGVCLMLFGLIGGLWRIGAFFTILFTGKVSENYYNYMQRLMRWVLRVQARMMHLSDGYPAFGMDSGDDHSDLQIKHYEDYSKGLSALVFFLGGLILIPHLICIYVLMIGAMFGTLAAWFSILFTGNYPPGIHKFVVSTLRWWMRVILYLHFLNPNYPPFSGKTDEELAGSSGVLDS